jgi:hypothetical protein
MRQAVGAIAMSVLVLQWVGCAPRVIQPTSMFDPQATQAALSPGKATITGQAFKKTVGGDVKYGAGNTIMLFPLTPYFAEFLALLPQKNAFTQISVDPRIMNHTRTTIADGDGRFRFNGLSPGQYYLETSITWGIPTAHGLETTGGTAAAIVSIEQEGQTVEVILQ